MILDIIILLLLAASTLIAFMRGFIREALTLLTLAATSLACYKGGPALNPIMDGWMGVTEGEKPEKLFNLIPMDFVSLISSYGLIFLILIIVFSIASHLIAEFIKSIGLGAIDRSLGALFGLIRGILLLAILYMPMHFLLDNESKQSWFKNSHGHPYLEQSAEALADMLPNDFIKDTQDNAEDIIDGATSKNARDKLEDLEILPKALDMIQKQTDNNEGNTDQEQGYDADIRRQLDRLIEESVQPDAGNE